MLLNIFVFLAALALTRAQRRYYSLEDMPETNFDCRDKILGGYYADPEANCQMFHVCVKIPGQGVQDFRFLCPNETSFDQENQICADSGDIDCTGSGLYLENFDLYRIGSAPAKRPLPQVASVNKGTAIPLGPSTKSPILTNNIYEDDDFYLQKSDTGDRRLHSKDILRGSSSSNFFNNRNNGKDLEDDDDDTVVRKPENANNQFRSRPSFQNRPKTQYQSQFRKAESTTQVPTTKQQILENRNQITDKKRTKIAVRKLTRKRPEEEGESQPTQQPQQQSAFTTQVTQKFGFTDSNTRYNTVNRQSTTPSTIATSEVFRQQPQPFSQQQPQQQFPQQQFSQQQPQQQRFQNFRRNEQQTTPAFFEASSTTQPGSKDTTPFSLLRNPIVAAGPNYNQQNRGSTDLQQNRQTTANYPSPANTNFPTPAQNSNFPPQQQQQQSRQTTPGIPTNFPQQRPIQQNRQQPPVNNGNFQQQPQQQKNFQQQPNSNFPNFPAQQNRQQVNNGNFQQQQQNRQSSQAFNGNFQQPQQQQQQQNLNRQQPQQQQQQNLNRQQPQQQQQQQNLNRQQPQVNGNFPQNNFNQNRQQGNNANFQQNRQQQTTAGLPNRNQNGQQQFNAVNKQQNYNAQQNFNDQQNFNGQQQNRQVPQRQAANRNFDDFDEGDNQEFLKTAPSNNYRPSDLNSFTNNYKQEAKNNSTRYVQTSTTKYITPTIITTPKTTQNFDASSTIKQNYYPSQQQQSTTNYYTPTVSTTQRIQSAGSSALPQRIYPSPTPAKPAKDVAYDYAYYDDAGSFSEYDSVDHLGESDFSRTSQRAKYRLI